MANIFEDKSDTIRVSAINSIGTYFLPLVYNRFLKKYPNYNLEIQDMELPAVTKSILDGNTDLAFTSGKSSDDRLLQTPIYFEKMVLIGGKNFNNPVSFEQLKKSKEIYVEWSHHYAVWHRQNFKNNHPQITISIMSQLKQFLEQEDCWAIVPISIANNLSDSKTIILETNFDIPNREISVLTAIDNNNDIIKDFFKCIKKVTNEMSDVQSLI